MTSGSEAEAYAQQEKYSSGPGHLTTGTAAKLFHGWPPDAALPEQQGETFPRCSFSSLQAAPGQVSDKHTQTIAPCSCTGLHFQNLYTLPLHKVGKKDGI